MKLETKFYLKQLNILIGGTITKLAVIPAEDDHGDELFGFVVTLPNGSKRTIFLLSDDEGNAPGSFEIRAD